MPTRRQLRLARAQQSGYVSQGRQVAKAARRADRRSAAVQRERVRLAGIQQRQIASSQRSVTRQNRTTRATGVSGVGVQSQTATPRAQAYERQRVRQATRRKNRIEQRRQGRIENRREKRIAKRYGDRASRLALQQQERYVDQGRQVAKAAAQQNLFRVPSARGGTKWVDAPTAARSALGPMASPTQRAELTTRLQNTTDPARTVKQFKTQRGIKLPSLRQVAGFLGASSPDVIGAAYQDAGPKQITKGAEQVKKFIDTQGLPRGSLGQSTIKGPAPVKVDQKKVAKNLAKDAVDYGTMAVPAAVEVGRAGVEAIGGDSRRAKKLAREAVDNSFLLAAAKAGVTQDSKEWRRAKRLFEEHPGFSVAEVFGATGAAGRTIGAVGRNVPRAVPGSATARRAAGTKRSDRPVPGTNISERRHYSPNVFTKTGQVAADRLAARRDRQGKRGPIARAKDTRAQNRYADFLSDRAVNTTRLGREREGREIDRMQPTRGKTAAGRAIDRRLPSGTGRVSSKITPKALTRPERDVVSLLIERRVRSAETLEQDLRSELRRLERVRSFRTPGDKQANRDQQRAITRVLGDRRALANARGIAESAGRLARKGEDLQSEAVLRGALDPKAAERAKLFPYAQLHMKAKWSGEKKRLEVGGRPVTNAQIKAHMRDSGVPSDRQLERDLGTDYEPDVAYLPHRQDVRGARAYYTTAYRGRPNLDKQRRTGKSLEQGTYESSFDLTREHAQRMRGVVQRLREHDDLVHDVGTRRPDGRLFTWQEAQDFADNLAEGDAKSVELVPYRALPAKYAQGRFQRIVDEQDAAHAPDYERLMADEFAQRLRQTGEADTKARNVVLIPKRVADRLAEQMKPTTEAGRVGNVVTNTFRGAVLPFSVRWITGNVIETALRLAMVGMPNARVGKRVLDAMQAIDADAAIGAEAALTQGLFFGQRGQGVKRSAEQFQTPTVKTLATAIAGAGKAPGIKQTVGAIKFGQQAVMAGNRAMEQSAQRRALTKVARREMRELNYSWWQTMRAQEKAVEDVANGLLETKNQIDAARYLDETLGRYSRFGPGLRRAVQSGLPFLPWYLNSLRFVYWTLPVKHPVKSALLVTVEKAIEDEFKAQHEDYPGNLARAPLVTAGETKLIGGRKGEPVDVARYTPFGLPTDVQGDLGEVTSPLFPQAMGVYNAFNGRNAFGDELKQKGKKWGAEVSHEKRLEMAASSIAEAYIPFVRYARQYREGGKSPWDDSTVWSPKTKTGKRTDPVANRILNPLRPIPFAPKVEPTGRLPFNASHRSVGSGSSTSTTPGAGLPYNSSHRERTQR